MMFKVWTEGSLEVVALGCRCCWNNFIKTLQWCPNQRTQPFFVKDTSEITAKKKSKLLPHFHPDISAVDISCVISQMHWRIRISSSTTSYKSYNCEEEEKSDNNWQVLSRYILGIFWVKLHFEHRSSLNMKINLLLGIKIGGVCVKCSSDMNEASNHMFFSMWVFRCGFYYALPPNSKNGTVSVIHIKLITL